jgi:L-amino acid N-acyltransferase YncA
MNLAPCTRAHAPEILAIFNHAILHTTALYDYEPRTPEFMDAWFRTKEAGDYPVIGAFEADGTLAGFATYGVFRAFPAYRHTVEHSVYVHPQKRRLGVGRQLLHAIVAAAQARDYHVLVGVIDAANEASIRLHTELGFTACGRIRQAGYKFDRWLDVDFYQLLLPTPSAPGGRPR